MKNLKLIDGVFNTADAKEILLNMISSKIQFHTNRNFSSEIRTGIPDENSRARLSELRQTREQSIAYLEKAEKENFLVNIESFISLSCSKGEQTEKL